MIFAILFINENKNIIKQQLKSFSKTGTPPAIKEPFTQKTGEQNKNKDNEPNDSEHGSRE